jgi:hypothetical protein
VLNVSLNWSISWKSLSSSTRSSLNSGPKMLPRPSHTSAGTDLACWRGVIQSRPLLMSGQITVSRPIGANIFAIFQDTDDSSDPDASEVFPKPRRRSLRLLKISLVQWPPDTLQGRRRSPGEGRFRPKVSSAPDNDRPARSGGFAVHASRVWCVCLGFDSRQSRTALRAFSADDRASLAVAFLALTPTDTFRGGQRARADAPMRTGAPNQFRRE